MHRSLFIFFAAGTIMAPAVAQDSAWSQFQLTADETPKLKPWTEAASISFVSGEGEDSVDVDIAARYSWQPDDWETSTMFVRALVKANDRAKTQEEVFKLGAGYSFETGGQTNDDLLLYSDIAIGFQQNKVFAKPDIPQCLTNPDQVFCSDQQETRVVGTWSSTFTPVALQSDSLSIDENDPTDPSDDEIIIESSPRYLYTVSPIMTLFYDEVLDATTDPSTGLKIDGRALGASVTLGGYFSPKLFNYALEFKSTYKHVVAFDREGTRKPGFAANADLFKASIDYNFGKPSVFEQPGWRPAIGISYSSGEDPLTGRREKEETVLSFKLTHRAG